jgi:transposase
MQGDRSRKVGGRRTRRVFSAEFKAEAVRLVLGRGAGVSLSQLARQLDVGADLLRDWTEAAAAAEGPTGPEAGETLTQEVQRLRRENAELREEQAFVKKVAVYFAKASR